MRAHNKILLAAEEQLVFGRSIPEMRRARDNLRIAVPGSLLLGLLEAKITRAKNLPNLSVPEFSAHSAVAQRQTRSFSSSWSIRRLRLGGRASLRMAENCC